MSVQAIASVGTALLGGLVAAAYAPGDADRRFVPLLAVWLAAPVAFLLDRPGSRPGRSLGAAAASAAVGAAIALFLATRREPPWWSPGRELPPGTLLACAAWTGHALAAWLLLTITTLPAPLALLGLRRLGRQLEWQAAAAALGPPIVGVSLFPELATVAHVWALALAGLPVGVGAYVVDHHLLGAAGAAAFPDPTPTEESARWRRVVLGIVVVGGYGWSVVWGHVGPAFTPEPVAPGQPDVVALLEGVRARQERHRERSGEYARALSELDGIDRDVAGGYAQGHVLRFVRYDRGSWAIAADAAPARLGWPSYRLVVTRGEGRVETGRAPFSLVDR